MESKVPGTDPNGRCGKCPRCRPVTATGGWSFNGCYHPPYKGKWVAEIKYCPKAAQPGSGEVKD